MDEYIIGNYIKSEREYLITSFKGSLERIGVQFKGNLLLTNLRFAGIGTLKRIPVSGTRVVAGWMLAGLVGAALVGYSALDDKQKKNQSKRH